MVTVLKNMSLWNMVLMVFSLVLAVYVPFELFLLAYAVLGPLHYLTEINWLNEKSFFLKQKRQAWMLIAVTGLTTLIMLARVALPYVHLTEWVQPLTQIERNAYGGLVLFGLVMSIGLVYAQRWRLALLIGGLLSVSLYFTAHYSWLVGMFLPSLIHVYLFTGLFILYGAIRTANKIAFLEAGALALMPVIVAFMPLEVSSYSWNHQTLDTFRQSNFQQISVVIGTLFKASDAQHPDLFLLSEAGIRIQIFIAFAYLYHYLNWFSKVSLIGWLKHTSSARILFIIVLWLLSISLYAYHYAWGLSALFLLSLLHVTLEFPLNVISANEVIHFIRKRF